MRLSGYEARFIALGDEINRAMPDHVVELVADGLNDRHRAVKGARILALGVAYKRGIGDIRESPALEILASLRKRGAEVAYVDPYVSAITLDGSVLKAVELTEGEVAAADCVLILTDHPEFDYRRVVETAALVVDTRNATWGIPAPAGRILRF
jgi:UDP-N-acetyl-D-glucosamine dehydrogenase